MSPSPLILFQAEMLTKTRMIGCLSSCTWPTHLDPISRRCATQAKMKRRGVRRKIGTLAAHRLQIAPAARPDTHESADSLPVAFLAFERNFDPVSSFRAVGTQQNQWPTVAGNGQIHVAVIIEVGRSQSACVERAVKVRCNTRQNVLVSRAIAMEQKGRG